MPKKKYKMSPKDMAMVVDRVMPMEGEWKRFMGRPEERGCWLV